MFYQAMAILFYVLTLTNMVLLFSQLSSATDIITQSQSLLDDGRTTLVSTNGRFELGFFSPGSSTNRYVGIWFKSIPIRTRTIVWVANRDKPIKNNSGMLTINTEGHLVLLDQNKNNFWRANSSAKSLNPIVQLLGSGNLVLRDEKDQNSLNYLWQSYDYPCDTFLPGMKLGWDLRTGLNRRLTAWKNWDDPSPGDFTWEFMLHKFPDGGFWKGSTLYYRFGPWIGLGFSGGFGMKTDTVFYDLKFVSTKDEVYYSYSLKNESMITIGVMNQTQSFMQSLLWNEEAQNWRTIDYWPVDNCDRYNYCGPYASCIVGQPLRCQCLRGFKPKSPRAWDLRDWTEGCVHSEPWSCREKSKDNFLKFSGLKFPDTTHSWVNASMTLEECKSKCWENCSCTAYANSDNSGGGSGCAIWFHDLHDMKQISDADQDLYIRVTFTETANHEKTNGNIIKVSVIIASILAALLILAKLLFINKRRRKSTENIDEGREEDMELPFYDFAIIANATNNFSSNNKLGQGGFGPVYKGTLVDGQEIAVKRLSPSSYQGMREFKNEVILCAKLQHRNLVKVLGFCIQGEEKMLIYEYMPNKSLDSFIFGSEIQSKLLDWSKRFHIICGIARGLLYLHQDSRLRIIHRDLKASNILLDNELNPKISDFGLARIFEGDKREQNTSKVVGTYGYIAPEYAFDGLFSTKSDVFSFGILLLEIVSGIRNKVISYPDQSHNLIGHAWRLWEEGDLLKLIDTHLEESCIASEAMRCIHIGLLCVQQHPDDRPNMTSVVVMLNSEGTLAQPIEPGFLSRNTFVRGECSGNLLICSKNEISITQIEAR